MGAELDLGDRATIPFCSAKTRRVMCSPLAQDAVEGVLADAALSGVPVATIGRCGGDSLVIAGAISIPVDRLRQVHEAWLPSYMSGEL